MEQNKFHSGSGPRLSFHFSKNLVLSNTYLMRFMSRGSNWLGGWQQCWWTYVMWWANLQNHKICHTLHMSHITRPITHHDHTCHTTHVIHHTCHTSHHTCHTLHLSPVIHVTHHTSYTTRHITHHDHTTHHTCHTSHMSHYTCHTSHIHFSINRLT